MEMLIVLAYTQLTKTEAELVKDVSSFTEEKIDLKYSLNMMTNFELEITYAPIFKELTTKYASNMEKRRGVNFEKKFNMTDRIVSYNETKSKLTNEMNRKGNVKELFSEKYRNLSDAMPVNSIINDNYYITSRDIELHNDLVMVDYVLQKDFLLENEDIRLPVSFDIYDIPYEYVNRELSIDNYLIFNDEYSSTLYRTDKPGANIDLIKKLFTETTSSETLDGTLYGRVGLDLDEEPSLDLLVRMAKIDSGSTMILSGRFPDNYSAGLQRYSKKTSEELDIVYSQPFRYTNSKGKVEKITSLQLGWGYTPLSNLRLRDKDGEVDYDIKEYPDATNLQEFTTVLFGSEEDLLLNKDAREGLSFVHTSYLLSQNDDIKFYNLSQ